MDSQGQGRTETPSGCRAKANFAAIWALFKLVSIVGEGPLKWWAPKHCPNANGVSPPLVRDHGNEANGTCSQDETSIYHGSTRD